MNTSSNDSKNLVEIDGLSFGYEAKPVLDSLNLDLKAGELTCLLGANGAGKTTLINLILGRLKSETGTIKLFGEVDSIQKNKKQIGAMLQNSTAPDKAKVKELIEVFASYYDQPLTIDELTQLLALSPILDNRFDKLSGGQKQLVLFALVLCGNPQLIFLDEPTVGMDVEVRRTLWAVIETLKKQGKSIVLTTHYLEEADLLSDRIVVLQNGKIVADGTSEEIKSSFQSKLIKAKSNKPVTWLAQLPQVTKVNAIGAYVELVTKCSEETLKSWITTDESIEDLSVKSVDLEEAFMNIVSDDSTENEKNELAA